MYGPEIVLAGQKYSGSPTVVSIALSFVCNISIGTSAEQVSSGELGSLAKDTRCITMAPYERDVRAVMGRVPFRHTPFTCKVSAIVLGMDLLIATIITPMPVTYSILAVAALPFFTWHGARAW